MASSDPHQGGDLFDMAKDGTTIPNDAGKQNLIPSVPRPDQINDPNDLGAADLEGAADNATDIPRVCHVSLIPDPFFTLHAPPSTPFYSIPFHPNPIASRPPIQPATTTTPHLKPSSQIHPSVQLTHVLAYLLTLSLSLQRTKDIGSTGGVLTGTGDQLPAQTESKRLHMSANNPLSKGHDRYDKHTVQKESDLESSFEYFDSASKERV
ncbi:hypothetical protein MMC06_001431 [Schaereria dolodes]|nr:hypothetical protein [Schaereria dolodes]